MADRVHSNTFPVSAKSRTTSSGEPAVSSNRTAPPAGVYVIQFPKLQVYRYHPLENELHYANYTRRNKRQCQCCCCLCRFICFVFTLTVLLGIATGVFYFIFRPEVPRYTTDSVSVKGMNLTSLSAISPEFDVSIKVDNGNHKIGIYYENDSFIEMFYRDVRLCNGVLPAFYQPSNNVTVFQTVLKGNSVKFESSDRRVLLNAVAKRNVPLTLKLRVPVKIKVGPVKMWKIRVKVDCDVTVDQLTVQAKIVDKDCSYGFNLW